MELVAWIGAAISHRGGLRFTGWMDLGLQKLGVEGIALYHTYYADNAPAHAIMGWERSNSISRSLLL